MRLVTFILDTLGLLVVAVVDFLVSGVTGAMRSALSVLAGSPGSLLASGAAIATFVMAEGGHLPALAASAWTLFVWGSLFAVVVMGLAIAAQVAGIYDDTPRVPVAKRNPR